MPVELQQTVDSPTELSFPCNKFPGSEASSNFKVLKRSRCRTGGTGLNSSGTIRRAAIWKTLEWDQDRNKETLPSGKLT